MLMKKAILPLALAIATVALSSVPAYADTSNQGCASSCGKAAGCSNRPTSVPEPSSLALLVVGLVVVGGVAVAFGRKRLDQA
jgi:hypothetical protein